MPRTSLTLLSACSLWIAGLLSAGCGITSDPAPADGHHLLVPLSGLTRSSHLRVQLLDGMLQPVARFETDAEVSGDQVLSVPDQAQVREGTAAAPLDHTRVRCVEVRTIDGGPILSGRAPVRWERGTAPITLAAPVEMVELSQQTTGGWPISNRVAIADLNGDQLPDLIVGNTSAMGLAVLWGNGNGTFTAEPITTSSPVESVSAADVNGDGKLDIVFSSATTGEGLWVVQQRLTGGAFLAAVAIGGTAVTGKVVNAFALGHVGTFESPILRLAMASSGTDPAILSVDAKLTATIVQPLPMAMWFGNNPASQISFRDLNADGAADLAIGVRSSTGNNLLLALNSGGMFPNSPTETYALGSAIAAFSLADVSGDGRVDLLAAMNNSGQADTRVGVILRSRNETSGTPTILGGFPLRTRAVVAADFDGDQELDLAVIGFEGSTIDIRRGLGNGAFSPRTILRTPVSLAQFPYQMVIGDFNRDCKPDVAIAYESNTNIAIFSSQ